MCSVAAAAESGYRLAGIIAPANGNALALIELPGGEQQLFRQGDALGDGRVVDIDATSVRLEFPDGDVLLELAGTGFVVVDEPTEYRRQDYQNIGTHPVAPEKLAEVSRLADSEEEVEAKDLALKVMKNLNLPVDARITAVADQPVSSIDEALEAMAGEIKENADKASPYQFVLSISDASGNKRMYVFNDESENGAATISAN